MRDVNSVELQELLDNNKKVMVDIWASWCTPCKMVVPILERLKVPENVEIVKLNFDENSDYVRGLNVRSIPTIILFNGNEELERLIGVKTYDDYTKNLNLLSEK